MEEDTALEYKRHIEDTVRQQELCSLRHVRLEPSLTQVHLPAPLHIISDSRTAIDGLTSRLQHREDRGYIGTADRIWYQATASWLRERGALATLQWVKGHSDSSETSKRTGSLVPVHTSPTPTSSPRASTPGSISLISNLPTDRLLWKAARHSDFTFPVRIFLWKAVHGAHRVGDWWLRVPTYEHRGQCRTCGVTETMEHILTECSAPGQCEVWHLTRNLWERSGREWLPLTFGTVIACGMALLTSAEGNPLPGPSRLYRILVSEAAHLIWAQRRRRVIEHDDDPAHHPTRREIHGRWRRAINSQLAVD
ncbi:hypothetical protein EIP86_000267 [Pleurotus ostreatoroseus]|nr:hypothetical protein EIP86_000267 [Pleurotus ostreatoroseus]